MDDRSPTTVVIADDNEDIRTLIRMQLERDGRFEIVGETDDASSAMGLLRRHRPAIATLDLHMGGMEDLSVLNEARAASPDTTVVIVTGTYHPGQDPDLDAANIAGWMTKDEIMSGFADRLLALRASS